MIDWERDQSTTMGEGVKWGPELEVALFHSMHGHKPAGEGQLSLVPGPFPRPKNERGK